jgi:hypothetical protein
VHIGDRESDIFELFCAASELGTHFLVRACTDRLAGDDGHTVADEMAEVRVKGLHRIEFCDAKGLSSAKIRSTQVAGQRRRNACGMINA